MLSVALVRVFSVYALKHMLDIPNARSAHQEPIPRGGGVVFVLLWIICLLMGFELKWFSFRELFIFLPTTFLISFIGFWDDKHGLTVRKRLIVQILVAVLSVAQLGDVSALHWFGHSVIHLGWIGTGLVIIGLVWSTNIYNFMDGLDGVAAIEALFVFGLGGLLFWNAGAIKFALLVWALVLVVSGFLVWNWPKARIFMGDVGSYCLGFLVALFALVGDQRYHIPITLWVILYSLFWFDATVTMLRRLWNGENIVTAHREHACQRLHRAGFSSTQILIGIVILNCILSGIAFYVSIHTVLLKWGLVLAVAILSVLYGIVERLQPMANNVVSKKHPLVP